MRSLSSSSSLSLGHSQIYEWGGEGYDGLGDMLDEAGDDLNADTFGAEPSDIGE